VPEYTTESHTNPPPKGSVGQWLSSLTDEEQSQAVGLLARLLRGLLEPDGEPPAEDGQGAPAGFSAQQNGPNP
jgi:hypothetical protein